MKSALIVAFHFPPFSAGSGILRMLKFCRFLPEFGWQPTVLTASTRAYERTNDALLAQIPPDVPVVRAFALDTQKHLSFRGRYFRWTALPDRWATWTLAAVWNGLFLIRRRHVDVILTTYPVATSILIGFLLHRLSGKPWVVDFRDSMTEENYPEDPQTRRVYQWIEAKVAKHATRLIFTAASTLEMYRKRYPSLSAEKCLLIPNGYDEEDFQWLTEAPHTPSEATGSIRLLHLGVIYPGERDPRPFFRALARLKESGRVKPGEVMIELRASGSEDYYKQLLKELNIEDLVYLLPPLPYPEALREAAASDGLLLFQAANCDHQIPAKAYEYLRIGRPTLALTSHIGDTAALLREAGGATIVDLADEEAIFQAVPNFLDALRKGIHSTPNPEAVQRYARKNQARTLAQNLSLALGNADLGRRHDAKVSVPSENAECSNEIIGK
jgi:glycosyltransferase involved in cell wall biosynthesis